MGSDRRHVKRDIVKSVVPLHMHVVVLDNKVNAKYVYFYFYFYCYKCKSKKIIIECINFTSTMQLK